LIDGFDCHGQYIVIFKCSRSAFSKGVFE
jgi:hypothetical protein